MPIGLLLTPDERSRASRGVAWDFEAASTIRREYFERRRRFPVGGVGACSPRKI